jgi:hypothetical protein
MDNIFNHRRYFCTGDFYVDTLAGFVNGFGIFKKLPKLKKDFKKMLSGSVKTSKLPNYTK